MEKKKTYEELYEELQLADFEGEEIEELDYSAEIAHLMKEGE